MLPSRRHTLRAAVLAAAAACLLPGTALADTGTGGVSPTDPQVAPPSKARIVGGKAVPPTDAPEEVRRAIEAANRIVEKPYKYGGGHAAVEDRGYDCSGAVSYALIGAGLLKAPLSSSGFMTWGESGPGRWITVWTNPGHAFVMIAGLRLDTGMRDRRALRRGVKPGRGPRWGYARPTTRFLPRHPKNL